MGDLKCPQCGSSAVWFGRIFWAFAACALVSVAVATLTGMVAGTVFLFTLLSSSGIESHTAATIATFFTAAPTTIGIGACVLLADRRSRS